MELIDALCILKMGYMTEAEKKVFEQAQNVIQKRVDYIRAKIQQEELDRKIKFMELQMKLDDIANETLCDTK